VVAVQVALTLPVLFGMAIITVDAGALYNARTDMQRAADAAALAAVAEFAYPVGNGNPTNAAMAAAEDFVERNPVLGQTLTLDPETDIILGHAYYDTNAGSYSFVAGDTPTNAIRVVVRHSQDSPNGPLPLFFAGVFGKTATDVSAAAVAMYVPTCAQEVDCHTVAPSGSTVMCHYGDADDSDDSQGEFGTPDSDDSDDSDLPFGGVGGSDSEGHDSSDSDAGETILVDTNAVPLFESKGDTLGACGGCQAGADDDSDDSQGEFGPPDSADSDDSDPGDSDGSFNGDSDDSDDSQGEFGPPDSDDSDDSDPGDSDGSFNGDSDDSDDSQGEFGPPDSDDSDDSQGDDSGSEDDSGSDDDNNNGQPKVTICHVPPGNPANAHTITISTSALPAHLAHGDTKGACIEEVCAGSTRMFLIQ